MRSHEPLALLLLSLSVVGCGGPAKPKIQLGAVLSVTGDLSTIGNEQLEAARLAAKEINEKGGILGGSQLEIVNKDDESDTDKAGPAAEALVALKVPVVIGAVGSGKTIAASTKLIAAGIPVISASSTSPEITGLADNDLVFRTCPSDAQQGKLLAKRARAKPFSRVAILHVPDPYGTGLADAFASAFTATGGTVTYKQAYVEGLPSYVSLLADAYAGNPEAILLVAYAVDGARIVTDYLNNYAAQKNTFFYFTDGTQDTAFVTAVGGSKFASLQHEGTGPAAPSTQTFSRYADAFKTQYGQAVNTGSFSQNAYDAVYLAALAMEAGGAASADAVKTNLAAVSAGGAKFTPSDFAKAREEAAAKRDIDFDGASGNVDLDARGEPTAPYAVWRVTNGSIQIVEAEVSP